MLLDGDFATVRYPIRKQVIVVDNHQINIASFNFLLHFSFFSNKAFFLQQEFQKDQLFIHQSGHTSNMSQNRHQTKVVSGGVSDDWSRQMVGTMVVK